MPSQKIDVVITGNSKQLRKELGKLQTTTQKTKAALSKIGPPVVAGLAAISVAIGKSIKDFAKFEADFTNVATLLDKTSFSSSNLADGIDSLKNQVLDLGARSGESFENLNKGLFDLISAGVPAEKAITALRVSVNLAKAGATDTSTAVDGLTSAINAYGLNADEAQSVSEKFFTAQKFGKTTIEELSANFGKAGATAASFGVSLDELLGAISAVTLGGVKTEAAFTGVNAVLSNIAKPTKDAADEAKRLGIEFNSTALRSKGLEGFLNDLSQAEGFTAQSIEKLFGSVEAQKIAFSLTGQQADKFKETIAALGDEQGRAETFTGALNTKLETTQDKLNRLDKTWEKLWINLGDKSKGAIDTLVHGLDLITNAFDPVIEAQEKHKQSLIDSIEVYEKGSTQAATFWEKVKTFTIKGTKGITDLEEEYLKKRADFRKKWNEDQAAERKVRLEKEQQQAESAQQKDQVRLDAAQQQKVAADAALAAQHELALQKRLEFNEFYGITEAEQSQMFSDEEIARKLESNQKKLEVEQKSLILQAKEKDKFKKGELEAESLQVKLIAAITKDGNKKQIKAASGALDTLAGLANSGNAHAKKVGKAAAVVQMTIATTESAYKAYASLAWIPYGIGPVLGAVAASAIVADGASKIGEIQSLKEGGIVGPAAGSARDRVPTMLESGEFVIPRGLTRQLAGDKGAVGFQGGISAGLVPSTVGDSLQQAAILTQGGRVSQTPAASGGMMVQNTQEPVEVIITMQDGAGEFVSAQQRGSRSRGTGRV